jgi:hypothetical protein
MSIRTILEVAAVGWLVVALAVVHDLRRDQEREFRRYVAAVCTDGVPPPDFHGRQLDHVLQGAIGNDLLEGCEATRRSFEAELAAVRARRGEHWASDPHEAAWAR